MIFDEIYGHYYATVAAILKASTTQKLTLRLISRIASEHMNYEAACEFTECFLNCDEWNLMSPGLKCPVRDIPYQPITKLERSWMKSLLMDPRIDLFDVDKRGLEDVEPLWKPENICIYDARRDSDPWNDQGYIDRFKLLRRAIAKQCAVKIEWREPDNSILSAKCYPQQLEYSVYYNRFDLIAKVNEYTLKLELRNIITCSQAEGEEQNDISEEVLKLCKKNESYKTVEFEVTNTRKAYERVSREFSIFYKIEAYQLGKDRFGMRLRYSEQQENELITRLLAFGPKIRVLSPTELIESIKKTIKRQCELLEEEEG